VLHSHDYRKPTGFENKRVLVIGIGNSGGDVATELSRCASQVYLSTRQGTWILHRVSDSGLPLDMLMSRRVTLWMKEAFHSSLVNGVIRWKLNSRLDHDLYCIRPSYEPLQQHPMVNDDMPNRIICGAILLKADVKTFTETGVEFVDGTSVQDIDVVVLATGYSFGFPFIDKEVMICWKLFVTDPVLAFHVVFGPSTPYQFRLFGPGKWQGARKAIVGQWDRIYAPLKTRPMSKANFIGILGNPVALLGLVILVTVLLLVVF
ncbi:putative dimethylaniline monooxygenase [N-oxide-forming] 6, partial [Aplysia californica]|uniref:Flavin-containing monooxygenase n=1 Tax=Aplysia californica TaxID=6500 RepID=A0ABM0KAW6_APLCA